MSLRGSLASATLAIESFGQLDGLALIQPNDTLSLTSGGSGSGSVIAGQGELRVSGTLVFRGSVIQPRLTIAQGGSVTLDATTAPVLGNLSLRDDGNLLIAQAASVGSSVGVSDPSATAPVAIIPFLQSCPARANITLLVPQLRQHLDSIVNLDTASWTGVANSPALQTLFSYGGATAVLRSQFTCRIHLCDAASPQTCIELANPNNVNSNMNAIHSSSSSKAQVKTTLARYLFTLPAEMNTSSSADPASTNNSSSTTVPVAATKLFYASAIWSESGLKYLVQDVTDYGPFNPALTPKPDTPTTSTSDYVNAAQMTTPHTGQLLLVLLLSLTLISWNTQY